MRAAQNVWSSKRSSGLNSHPGNLTPISTGCPTMDRRCCCFSLRRRESSACGPSCEAGRREPARRYPTCQRGQGSFGRTVTSGTDRECNAATGEACRRSVAGVCRLDGSGSAVASCASLRYDRGHGRAGSVGGRGVAGSDRVAVHGCGAGVESREAPRAVSRHLAAAGPDARRERASGSSESSMSWAWADAVTLTTPIAVATKNWRSGRIPGNGNIYRISSFQKARSPSTSVCAPCSLRTKTTPSSLSSVAQTSIWTGP